MSKLSPDAGAAEPTGVRAGVCLGVSCSSHPPCASSRRCPVGQMQTRRLHASGLRARRGSRGFVTHPTCLVARPRLSYPTACSATIFSHLPELFPLWSSRVRSRKGVEGDEDGRQHGAPHLECSGDPAGHTLLYRRSRSLQPAPPAGGGG